MEEKHRHLFQDIWKKFSVDEYKDYIDRYVHRLQINNINVKDLSCIDCGCGNGNFAHALIQEGARYVYGIDFGKDSIEYAKKARCALNITSDQIEFKTENVYNISKEDNTFDFAIQNGVFHHLEDEDKAYKEVWRVLKQNAWFWIYTDGGGGISYDLWDASVYILRNVNYGLIIESLDSLNLNSGKKCHLSDALVATYRHTTYKEIIDRLSRLGFGNFRRLVGGFDTDFDYDVIEKDKYGKEKFGDGDLRILAQKII